MSSFEPYDVILEISQGGPKPSKNPSNPKDRTGAQDTGRVSYITAKLPDDGVGFAIESSWSTPFAEISGGVIGQLLSNVSIAGYSLSMRFQMASFHIWGGSSPIRITIPFEFQAQTDAIKEVLTPIVRLMMLAAPKVTKQGGVARFIAPGPSLANVIAEAKKVTANIPGVNAIAGMLADMTETSISTENMILSIGNYFTLDNVLVLSAIPHFDTVMDRNGIPMRGSCLVTFESYLTPSRDEIQGYFRNRVSVGKDAGGSGG